MFLGWVQLSISVLRGQGDTATQILKSILIEKPVIRHSCINVGEHDLVVLLRHFSCYLKLLHSLLVVMEESPQTEMFCVTKCSYLYFRFEMLRQWLLSGYLCNSPEIRNAEMICGYGFCWRKIVLQNCKRWNVPPVKITHQWTEIDDEKFHSARGENLQDLNKGKWATPLCHSCRLVW